MELDLMTLSDDELVALNLAVSTETTRRFANAAVEAPAPAEIPTTVTLPAP